MTGSGQSPRWHADTAALQSWLDGDARPLVAASVEQHVVQCEGCRHEVANLAALPALEQVWTRIRDEVEAPRVGVLERLLVRLHVPPGDAVVVATTPALRLSWLTALAAVLLFSVVAALAAGTAGLTVFLLVAPLAPVAGVAAAYGPSADPCFEVALSTPYSMSRLVLVRTAAVLLACVPLSVLAGVFLPTAGSVAIAWLLPATGFVVVILVASTWADPVLAAAVVASGWSLAVLRAAHADQPLDVLQPAALSAYSAITALALLLLIVRFCRRAPAWPLR